MPSVWALDSARELAQYNCRTWTRQNGLPVNGINAITQTPDGYLWLGTAGGLVRFDGTEFHLVDLSGVAELKTSVVRAIAPAEGGLWVGVLNSSFGFYDGNAFSFRGKAEWGGPEINVRKIFQEGDGTLLIVSQQEALRVSPKGEYTSVFPAGGLNIISAFRDADGTVWMGTSRRGAYYSRPGQPVVKFEPMGDQSVTSIVRDRAGDFWLGADKGIRRFDSNLNPREAPPLPAEARTLLVDRNGILWVGTDVLGLLRFRNEQFEALLPSQGLASDQINHLFEDREGSLWIGTSGGLSQLSDVKFPTFAAVAGRYGEPTSCVAPARDGGVWVGGRNALTHFAPGPNGKMTTYGKEAGLPETMVKRVYEAKNGELYAVCGLTTLVRISEGKVVAAYNGENLIAGITEDAESVIVSVGANLARVLGDKLVPYPFDGVAPSFVWILQLLAEDDGSFWVACEDGLFRIKGQQVLRKYAASDGIEDPRVESVFKEPDGTLWLGLLNGIARVKDGRAVYLNRKVGLWDDNIYGIVPDDVGSVWMESGRGLFRLTRSAIEDFARGNIKRVDSIPYDGIESIIPADKTDLQERLGTKSKDGRIWFPSAKGVVAIDPSHILTNAVAPPVQIGAVLANRVPLPRGQRVVRPGPGELEFQFTAPSFIAPQKTRFKYKLDGYDGDWVDAGARRIAFYTNLRPGIYTFQVIAANADGVWNETGASWTVELLPHFYQTTWFLTLCCALGVAALGGLYGLRMRQLDMKQRSLRESRDRLEKEVQQRTAQLATVNGSLKDEIDDHKRTELELVQRTQALEKEIEERKQMQQEIERVHRMLVDTSRQAGMAEIATNVLHNVGNVLNSVNVSCAVVLDTVRNSSSSGLTKMVVLLKEHEADLGIFISTDPRGKQVLSYLAQLSDRVTSEKELALKELESLRQNIEHIKEIVTMQQNYATVSGVHEIVNLRDLVEDSLRMNVGALDRHRVKLVREFSAVPSINVDKHKVLQILVNFVRNAKYACDESGRTDKQVIVRLAQEGERVRISVIDNGVGIIPENLTRIFGHGFTTRKDGHGFGLHSGALAAKEMGGAVSVHSDGPGKGATFTLELPIHPRRGNSPADA